MIALLMLALAAGAYGQDWTTPGCGQANRQYSHKIVGGDETERHEYPWQVSLQSGTFHYCGGSIIAPNVILTASHCVSNGEIIDVVAGAHEIISGTPTSQRLSGTATRHPNYNAWTFEHDAAVVVLDESFVMDPKDVYPLCRPDPNTYHESGDAIVSGWGTLKPGGTSPNELHAVTVPLVPNHLCNDDYDGDITIDMICAGDRENGGVDACQGDSGGPLVFYENGAYASVGIVSWGIGCAYPGYPGVYCRTTEALDFIDGFVRKQ